MSAWLVLSDLPPQLLSRKDRCLQTTSGSTALRWIEDASLPLRGILLSPHSWDQDFGTLLEKARRLRPGTPILPLLDDSSQADHLLAQPPIRAKLGLGPVLKLSELGTFLDADLLTRPERLETEHLKTERRERLPILEDGEFVGVPIRDFENVGELHFDLHLRLPSGKFLRLIEAREIDPWPRLRKYSLRGVRHLYILKEAHERSLVAVRLFRESLGALPAEGDAAAGELQAAQAIHRLSSLTSRLESIDAVDERLWEAGRDAAILLHRSLAGAQKATWLRRSLLLEHSLSVFVLSALLGTRLHFNREEAYLRLAMAALFHDIGLLEVENPPEDERPEGLTGSELRHFLEHPERSARHLEQTLKADSLVVQSVRHHHWRRDGSGLALPESRSPALVPRLAEILGIAEECTTFMRRNPQWEGSALAQKFLPRMNLKFSAETVESLQSILIHPRA